MILMKIRTSDSELFTKLNSLKFTDEVVVKASKKKNLTRILTTVNKKEQQITTQKMGDRIILKRLKPVNYQLYMIRR